jgi:hypothetical protein|nr:hypothetical protein [Kofleriaceae bacterium]
MRTVAALALAGCASIGSASQGVEHLTGAADVDHGGFRGARVAGEFGFRGVELSVDADVQRQQRSDAASTATGTAVDLGLRLSIFGLLMSDGDHHLEHWFDLGAEGRAGGGVTSSDAYGEVSAGGWVEIGLRSGTDYPALIVDVRREVTTGPWADDTVFGIALAWTVRTSSDSPDY